MKQGTGDDPFDNEPDDETEANSRGEHDNENVFDEPPAVTTDDSAQNFDPTDEAEEETQSPSNLPFLARRRLAGKSIKSNRDHVPFFLREDTQAAERDLRRAVEDELGQAVHKTNLREAAYVFAQRNPEGVVGVLREWGIRHLR